MRGQQGLMVETLFSTDGIRNTVDDIVYNALFNSGYEVILHHSNNGLFFNTYIIYFKFEMQQFFIIDITLLWENRFVLHFNLPMH